MQTISFIQDLQQTLQACKQQQKTISFVPTMGNLHEGHLSLVRLAKQHADIVVVSIFVNPLQFGANEDLDKYPRTLEADQQKLAEEDVNFLFTPQVNEIYPIDIAEQTQVCVPQLGEYHCGSSRPGHFDGVTTIVCKLFNIVQADIAIFGQKDFQQLAIIRKMVKDLCLPITIIAAPTGRAKDGLALSSRNQYLNKQQRQTASTINQCLESAASSLENGQNIEAVKLQAIEKLEKYGFILDYFNIADAQTLAPVNENSQEIVLLIAAFLGKTRLIDNKVLPLKPKSF